MRQELFDGLFLHAVQSSIPVIGRQEPPAISMEAVWRRTLNSDHLLSHAALRGKALSFTNAV